MIYKKEKSTKMLIVIISVKVTGIIETGRVGTWDCIFSSINCFSGIGHSEDEFLGSALLRFQDSLPGNFQYKGKVLLRKMHHENIHMKRLHLREGTCYRFSIVAYL